MNNKIIAVDVDLTFVDSLTPWLNWFKERTGRIPEDINTKYDLVPDMRKIASEVGMQFDPYDYWRQTDLYDDLSPLPGAVEALNELRENGSKIIFVSLCDPDHTVSKVRFLNRSIKSDGFISTSFKHFVAYDALIDDRALHHVEGIRWRPQAKHFYFDFRGTHHDSNEIPKESIIVQNWNETLMKIKEAFNVEPK